MSEGPTTTPPPAPQPPPPQQPYSRRGIRCGCERCGRRGLMGPVVLITIGLIFMADQFLWRVNFGDLWPLILIVIGVMKLMEQSSSTEGNSV